MERQTQTLEIQASKYDQLALYLQEQKLVTDAGRDEILFEQTVRFKGDMEMDIKVVNSEDGPWTEGVLYRGPSEVGMTSVGDSLDGEFIISYGEQEYCVVVKRSQYDAVCENCGALCEYHPIYCRCPSCGVGWTGEEWNDRPNRHGGVE